MQEQSSSIHVRSTAAAASGILPSRGISASLHPSMRPTTCFQGLTSLLGKYAFTLKYIHVRSTAAAASGILPSRGISASLHPSMRPKTCFQGLTSPLGEYAFTLQNSYSG